MSHFSRVATKINDLDLLKKSLDDLGAKYEENKKGVTFWNRKEPIDVDVYVSRSRYGYGFVRNAEGNFDIVADRDYQSEFETVRQKYVENDIIRQTEAYGYTVAGVEREASGEVVVTVEKMVAYGG